MTLINIVHHNCILWSLGNVRKRKTNTCLWKLNFVKVKLLGKLYISSCNMLSVVHFQFWDLRYAQNRYIVESGNNSKFEWHVHPMWLFRVFWYTCDELKQKLSVWCSLWCNLLLSPASHFVINALLKIEILHPIIWTKTYVGWWSCRCMAEQWSS